MKVWLNDLKVLSEIMKAEEITEHTYFITDVEYQGIKETLENNGFVWVVGNRVKYSGIKPGPEYRFDEELKEWVVDPDLQRLEKDKKIAIIWEKIKEEREHQNTLGFYVQSVDKWFHSDQAAINNYQIVGLSILLGRHQSQPWKTMDGTWVQMTSELFSQVMVAMKEHGSHNFQVAEQHYAALKSSQDPDTYDFSTNWKATYTVEG